MNNVFSNSYLYLISESLPLMTTLIIFFNRIISLQFFYIMGAVASQYEANIPLPSVSNNDKIRRSRTNQNIQNEQPDTNLSHKIGKQFKKCIVASKNIMKDTHPPPKSNIQHRDSNCSQISMASANIQPLEELYINPVFEVFSRVKIKKPTFQMIQIDHKKFLKTKANSIQQDYQFIKQIGKGGFGSVYRAKQIKTGSLRAVKKISKADLTPEQKLHLANQFQILCKLDHPNIIKLYDIYDDKNNLYVVTQLCEGGDLLKFVNKSRITESIMRSVMVQLFSALKYMHNYKILHRDIKLENIVLVKKYTKENEKMQIKIIDFGISVNLNKPISAQKREPQGTLLYMPPQCLTMNWLGLQIDMWACGIMLYMMTTRKLPYKYDTQPALLRQIQKGKINRNHLQKLSFDLKVFIMQLLEINVETRFTASKAIDSSWLKKSYPNSNLTLSARVKAAKNLLDYDAKNNLVSIIEAYLIFKKVNQDQRQRMASIFEQIDVDKSGIIEIDQLKKFYSQNSEHYDAQQVQELLQVMDKNKSGKIDFNQFITAMCDRRALFQKQALEEAFDFFDKDKSGEISKQQLEDILQGIKHEQIQYLFKQLDKNNDYKISKKEFMAYLSKY